MAGHYTKWTGNVIDLTLVAVWSHFWQVSQVGVRPAGEHPAQCGYCRIDACVFVQMWFTGQISGGCSCQIFGCLRVCVCVQAAPTLRTVPQESVKAGNRKQTSSSGSQSPWGLWFGYSNQSGSSMSSTNLAQRIKKIKSLLFYKKV